MWGALLWESGDVGHPKCAWKRRANYNSCLNPTPQGLPRTKLDWNKSQRAKRKTAWDEKRWEFDGEKTSRWQKNNPALSCARGERIRASLFLITLTFISQVWLRIPSCTLIPNLIHHRGHIHQNWHFHLCFWTGTVRRELIINAVMQRGVHQWDGPPHTARKPPQGRSKNSHFQGGQDAFICPFALRTFQWAVVSLLAGRWIHVFVYF